MPWAGLLAALSAGVLFNVGSALQALDAREAPADEGLRLKLLARLARRRRWIAGLLLGGLGFVLQVLAFAGAPFALRGGRLDSAMLVIVASALGFGATNIATKLLSDDVAASHWILAAAWGAVAAAVGVAATVTEMTALQRRRATTVIPISFGLQTFLPILIEPLYLREDWGTAALVGVPLVTGLALVLAGSVVLTRARSVCELAAGV